MNISPFLVTLLSLPGMVWAASVPQDIDTYHQEQLDALCPAYAQVARVHARVTNSGEASPSCITVATAGPGTLSLNLYNTTINSVSTGTASQRAQALKQRIALYETVKRALPHLSAINKGALMQGLVCYMLSCSPEKTVLLSPAEKREAADFGAQYAVNGVLNFHALLLADKQLSVQTDRTFFSKDELQKLVSGTATATAPIHRQSLICMEAEGKLMDKLETMVKGQGTPSNKQFLEVLDLEEAYLKLHEQYVTMASQVVKGSEAGAFNLLRFNHRRFLHFLTLAEKHPAFRSGHAADFVAFLSNTMPVPYHLDRDLLTTDHTYVSTLSGRTMMFQRHHAVFSADYLGLTTCDTIANAHLDGTHVTNTQFTSQYISVQIKNDLAPGLSALTREHEMNHVKMLRDHPELCINGHNLVKAGRILEANAMAREVEWLMEQGRSYMVAVEMVKGMLKGARISDEDTMTYNEAFEKAIDKALDDKAMRNNVDKWTKTMLEQHRRDVNGYLETALNGEAKVYIQQGKHELLKNFRRIYKQGTPIPPEAETSTGSGFGRKQFRNFDDNLVYAGEGTIAWGIKQATLMTPILEAITDKESADYYAPSVAKINKAFRDGIAKLRDKEQKPDANDVQQMAQAFELLAKQRVAYGRIKQNQYYGSAKLRDAYEKH